MDGLVGRGDDLAVLEGFLDRGPSAGARALLLDGPPGIGKTSLWTAGVTRARRRGFRVLVARPAPADAELGLLALADLLRDTPRELLNTLPEHQRTALIAAIDGGDSTQGVRALYPAVLNVLRAMTAEDGLVVAIDDLQWLDADSAGALGFALRRLHDREVRLLLARRLGAEATLHPWELAIDSERLEIRPLDAAETQQLVHERLGLALSRPQSRQLHRISAGNPLFVLELGRVLGRQPHVDLDRIALPDRVEALLEERVRALSDDARWALLTVTLAGESPVREVVATVGLDALDAAIDAGALSVDEDRVRPVHPLIGEVARQRAGARELRDLHQAIARAAEDPTSSALHLALATHGPDEAVAEQASAAAAIASARGSHTTAATLADHALRLTASDSATYPERLVAAADEHHRRGEIARVVELLRDGMERLTSPEHRGLAWFLLAECDDNVSSEQAQEMRRQALDDLSDYSPVLSSRLLAAVSTDLSITEVTSLATAESYAQQARAAADASGNANAVEESLAALCWARAMRGSELAALLAGRPHTEPPTGVFMYNGVDRIEAVSLIWRGEIDGARRQLRKLSDLAEDRGEEESYIAVRVHSCELALRSGRWAEVEAALESWMRELPVVEYENVYLTRCRALLQAGRGNHSYARDLALEAMQARGRGTRWNQLESLRALGLAQLLAGEPAQAAESLGQVVGSAREAGVGNPGTFPAGADLAEALALIGRGADAATMAQELSDTATVQRHPWAAAAAERAWGHVLMASGEDDAAAARFAEAATRFEAMDLQLDRCRSLIALGMARRRARRLRDAREALELAVSSLDELGSPGWAEFARAELARVGGRRRGGDDVLTVTEQQVAQLVQEGLANKQIAQRLVVSTSTVEAHLTRIYRKLGVASRTELARLLAEQSVGLSPIPDGKTQT